MLFYTFPSLLSKNTCPATNAAPNSTALVTGSIPGGNFSLYVLPWLQNSFIHPLHTLVTDPTWRPSPATTGRTTSVQQQHPPEQPGPVMCAFTSPSGARTLILVCHLKKPGSSVTDPRGNPPPALTSNSSRQCKQLVTAPKRLLSGGARERTSRFSRSSTISR